MANHEEILRALLPSVAADQHYEDPQYTITHITTNGANFTSKLFLVTISSKGKEDLKLFGKVSLLGKKIRTQVCIQLYEAELTAYKQLVPAFEDLQEANAVPKEHRLVFPKFYGFNDKELEETVILEDLSDRGFSCFSRFESVDWKYAAKAVEEMAKLHALCIAYAKENEEKFDGLMKKYRYDRDVKLENLNRHWNQLFALALTATTEENKKSLEKHYENKNGEFVYKEMRQTLRRPILVHSDYRPSNLMHKIHEDGSMELIPIDYQNMQAGCPVFDLQFFLMTATDGAFRKQHQTKLVDHYYQYLRDCLARLNLNPDEEYSREVFDSEWKELLPGALSMAIFSLPIVTVNEEDAPVIDSESDIDGFIVKKTSLLFKDRINEVVDDFRKWGVLT